MAGTAGPPLGDRLLAGVVGERRAVVIACESGVIAGLSLVDVEPLAVEGAHVPGETPIAALVGSARSLARAEDAVLGPLGVACGVATNAWRVRAAAPPGLRVVCGAWKKLPAAMKPAVRAGLAAANVAPRLLEGDFLYVDKNAVRLLGSVVAAVEAGEGVDHGPVAVQVKDPREAVLAARAGAAAVMVDTGEIGDLMYAHDDLVEAGLRAGVTLAFAGGVKADDLEAVAFAGADVVDVGRAVLASPLLDLRVDVVG